MWIFILQVQTRILCLLTIATLLTGRYVQVEMLPAFHLKNFIVHIVSKTCQIWIYTICISSIVLSLGLYMFEDDESIDEYLESILNTVIPERYCNEIKITDVPLLLDIIKYLLANIGSLINPTKIANTLTSYGPKRIIRRLRNIYKVSKMVF